MRVFILVLVLLFTIPACRTNPFSEIPEHLESQVKTFEGVVRWGALEKMYLFLKPNPDNPIKVQPGLDNVRVTGYEIGNPLSRLEDGRWVQTVVIDYVLQDRQIVRQIVDYQVWVRDDEDGKKWYRENSLPQFR